MNRKKCRMLTISLVPLLLGGCGGTLAYTAVGALPILAVGYVLERGGVVSGTIQFEDVAVDRIETEDPNRGQIRVTGHFEYAAAKVAGDRFANLAGVEFGVRLLDDAGEELTQFRWPLTLTTEGLTLAAVPSDELLPFEIERTVSRNVWELVASCEIVDVYGL